MYTDAMRRAFHNIKAPSNFKISLVDNEHFLAIKLDERSFLPLTHDEKIDAVKYIAIVKKALEMEGAIVLVTREPLQ
ncbi:MAG: hypothetical protein FJ356_04150 [Thaumarchaeota archaeon]|nr:hypothetical protein [Nitrososphaerota archaeon]